MFITIALVPILKRYAVFLHCVDVPCERKMHSTPMPKVGGIAMAFGALIPVVLSISADKTAVAILMGTAVIVVFGVVDDTRELGYKAKFAGQVAAALVVVFLGGVKICCLGNLLPGEMVLPNWLAVALTLVVIVGVTNAVNLADGLDGLAIGLTFISATALTALTYIAGHINYSGYLNIAYVAKAAELTVFAGALSGACLAFLWFNCHPAQVFMGDVGALSLGATLAVIAILIKQEFLLFTVAGVFILEAVSVLLQVGYFRISGGKRIFRMAPLHHHFELAGWREEQVVVRFWILGIIFALFSMATLKLR